MGAAAKETCQSAIKALKERLMDYRDREREIDNQIERIDNLRDKMLSIGSPELSDMPEPNGVARDRIGELIAHIDELERQVRDLIRFQGNEREWIEKKLTHLKKADDRACIRMRYIDVMSWPKVTLSLFGCNEDYMQRKDSYIRRTTKIHRRALAKMAEQITEGNGGCGHST